MDRIDAVIPWVTLDDDLMAQLRRFGPLARSSDALLPHRFRENGELSVLAPAIRRLMPWIGKIFVATNGQRPPRDVLETEGVRWVRHEEFFVDRAALPTFNSNAIGANLAFIDGLSERFLIFNDDCFVGRPLSADDFFAPENGAPIFRFEFDAVPREEPAAWARSLAFTDALLTRAFGVAERKTLAHVPFPCTRALASELWAAFGADLLRTSRNRFRDPRDAAVVLLCAYASLAKLTGRAGLPEREGLPNVVYRSRDEYVFVPVGEWTGGWQATLDDILRDPPKFFCLNDHIGEESGEVAREKLAAFFRDFRAGWPAEL